MYSSKNIVQARYLGSSEVNKHSSSTVIPWIVEALKHKKTNLTATSEGQGLLCLSMTCTHMHRAEL